MRLHILFMLLAALLSGCATTTQPTSLQELEARYQALNNNPGVRDNAPANLQNTGTLVKEARNAWQEDGDSETYRHLHYLASRSAEITELKAQQVVLETQMAAAQSRKQALQVAINDVEQRQTLTLVKDDVLFGFDEAKLKDAAENRLQQLTEYLKKNPTAKVMVEGHTDAIGTAEYNMKLSAERAEAVAKALVEAGIDPERIQLQAYGEQAPIATNDTERGRHYNRRAEIIIPKIEDSQEQ